VPASGPAAAGAPAAAPTLDPPAAAASVGAALATVPALSGPGSELLLSWVQPSGAFGHPIFQLRLSRFTGDRWSTPVTVAEGDDLFANWADFPGVVAGPKGEILAHWLAKSGDSYGAHLARSIDGGVTWNPFGKLEADPTAGEHGFVSYAADDGGVRAFWLEGSEGGSMSLRSARIAAGGPVGPVELLDERVCDCCQTSAVRTAAGPVVVYRDRSETEIRDISALRRTASGWAQPVGVHVDGWEITGCPVNGPAVAAEPGAGRRLAVAWFTAAPPGPRIQVAFSTDSGASFGPPVTVDAGRPVGRVDVKLDPHGAALVSWVAPAGATGPGAGSEKSSLWLRRVQPNGKAGPPYEVPGTRSVRASGFPRTGLASDRLLLAWVDDGEPPHLRASLVPLAAVP
jgi:hypothetical protein